MPSMVAVGDLIERGVKFLIPYYQRGYRWQRRHIEALLKDLWELSQELKRKRKTIFYYPLQPLVVKKDRNGFYRVVDGQQRLTTLYILLVVLEEKIQESIEKFVIVYERRSERFLERLRECEKEKIENIDFCYMCEAYKIVKEWIEAKNITKSNLKFWRDFITRGSDIEEGRDLNENIRFIWYELDESQDEFEVFIRLNIGKIPLTNAELIKSFLIQKVQDEKYRFEISKEWDDMEYALEDNEFFGFLTQKSYLTRIEIIFQIIMDLKNYKEYELYERFQGRYQKESYEQIWNDVREVFSILQYWYEERFFYHTIGYLIALKQKDKRKNIVDIFEIYKSARDKKDFKKQLQKTIASLFLEKDRSIKDVIGELSYGSNSMNSKIQDLLLLFNIATLTIASEKSYIKFSFATYQREKWSLEHITPQTDKTLTKDVIKELKELGIKELEDVLSKKKLEESDKKKIEDYFVDKDLDKDSVGNLTLLSTKNNSALSNGYFPIKRKKIIELDKEGAFIPICTKNLFLRYYSNKIGMQEMKWTQEDANNYVVAMQYTITNFLGENNG